jgi:hypothetical protein
MRAVGATIVNRVEDLRQTSETVFGLFNIETIGDEQIRLLLSHRYPKCLTANDLFPHLPDPVHDPESVPYTPPRTARGYPERHRPHLADAMSVACNVFNLMLVPASGAVEMAISVGLHVRVR